MKSTSLFFIALVLLINWGLLALLLLLGISYKENATMLSLGYMLVPSIIAIIISTRNKISIKDLGLTFKLNLWWLLALLLPIVIALASIPVSTWFDGIQYDPEMTSFFSSIEEKMGPELAEKTRETFEKMPIHPILILIFNAIIAGVTINAIAGLGEELGWRGYLFHTMRHHSFWRYTLLIGSIWGLWHAPLIYLGHNYPEHSIAGIFMMIGWCLLLSPFFTYVRIKTKSVIAAAIFHGTLNAIAGLPILYLDGGSDLTRGVTGAGGIGVLVALLALLVLADLPFFKKSLQPMDKESD